MVQKALGTLNLSWVHQLPCYCREQRANSPIGWSTPKPNHNLRNLTQTFPQKTPTLSYNEWMKVGAYSAEGGLSSSTQFSVDWWIIFRHLFIIGLCILLAVCCTSAFDNESGPTLRLSKWKVLSLFPPLVTETLRGGYGIEGEDKRPLKGDEMQEITSSSRLLNHLKEQHSSIFLLAFLLFSFKNSNISNNSLAKKNDVFAPPLLCVHALETGSGLYWFHKKEKKNPKNTTRKCSCY